MFSADNNEKLQNIIKKHHPDLSEPEIMELAQKHNSFAKMLLMMWLKSIASKDPP